MDQWDDDSNPKLETEFGQEIADLIPKALEFFQPVGASMDSMSDALDASSMLYITIATTAISHSVIRSSNPDKAIHLTQKMADNLRESLFHSVHSTLIANDYPSPWNKRPVDEDTNAKTFREIMEQIKREENGC